MLPTKLGPKAPDASRRVPCVLEGTYSGTFCHTVRHQQMYPHRGLGHRDFDRLLQNTKAGSDDQSSQSRESARRVHNMHEDKQHVVNFSDDQIVHALRAACAENWTNTVQFCPTPDKFRTKMNSGTSSIELTYRTDGRLEHI